ncbi:MAG: hypothetical protein LBP22_12730 [Deltaproteobacteria bacterium]|nr:hypothetical protein [Deltaproteobacteria bacterium]
MAWQPAGEPEQRTVRPEAGLRPEAAAALQCNIPGAVSRKRRGQAGLFRQIASCRPKTLDSGLTDGIRP